MTATSLSRTGSLGERLATIVARLFHINRKLPILLIYLYLRVGPILTNFVYSFYNSSVANPRANFAGLDNYIALFGDRLFIISLRNTTLFAISLTVFSVSIALLLAVLLSGKFRLGGAYEAIYFLPVITPMVAVAVVWKWIYDPTYGLLNFFLSWFGIKPVAWLVYPDTAFWAIVWKLIGYNMLIFLVGIRDIPETYFEAAKIDGAGSGQIFRFITLPLLRPILVFVTVISTINAYNVFTQIFVMTSGPQGAPGNAVRTLVFDIYENAFRYFKTGYAASEAVMLFLIVLALTLVQFGVTRQRDANG
ncbi:MAG: sugar ABC transporter permease [Anaerolineae bacterium]|nr:sugar ABC transporter permease [Anaerolineae bacterium]